MEPSTTPSSSRSIPVSKFDVIVKRFDTPPPEGLIGIECVFCSATIEDEGYLRDGYEVGRMLAGGQIGCVSSAGKSGIMGTVVRGSVDAGEVAGGVVAPSWHGGPVFGGV